jgi:hypothetical protein
MRGVGLAAVAAIGLMTLTAQPSYARTTDQGGLRTQKIDNGDRLDSKDAQANAVPGNSQTLSVTETLHYVNEPFWGWKHNTAYTIKRTVTATFANPVGYFVLHDNEGTWYQFTPGNANGVRLSGKPQASIGAQAQTLDRNDRGSLASVAPGNVVGGTPQLNATYNYSHSEQLDDVNYTVTSPVDTTFVADQNAYFARISGNLYRVDSTGRVAQLNDKPSVDRGAQPGLMDSSDSTGSYPDVVANGGFFVATTHHVHEDTFEHVRYTTQQEVRADYVPEANSYMAWIDGTEYQAQPGSSDVYRLNQRPVVQLGQRQLSMQNDRVVRTDVFSVSSTNVVIRYYFHRNETYVAKEYYVERNGVMYYNQNWSVWMVAIDGQSYVVAFDSDNFSDPSANILHAPAGSQRPQYSVPSTSGDGLPPAVVPGADPSRGYNDTTPPPASNGIPGRSAPAGIPGRAPSGNNCIPGRC